MSDVDPSGVEVLVGVASRWASLADIHDLAMSDETRHVVLRAVNSEV